MENPDRTTFSAHNMYQKCVGERKNRNVSRGKWPESAGKLTSREREDSVNDAKLDADRIPHVYYPLHPSRPSPSPPRAHLPLLLPSSPPPFPPVPPSPLLPSHLTSLDMARRTSPRAPPSREKQPRTIRLTINALLSLPVSVDILITHW